MRSNLDGYAEGSAAPPRRARAEEGPTKAPAPEGDLGDRLTELLVRHRWATVVPLVLPLSKVYDLYWHARHVHLRNFLGNAAGHEERVRRIQAQIRRWRDAGKPGLLVTSRKSWQSVTVRANDYKKQSYGIDVDLHDILEVDTERRVVRVEPRVNMGQLTHTLVPMGWTLPVVPELDDLTVGGLYLGYGIEASSHKYGLFADTVLAAEVVLADGRVVRASADENADLFRALPWSYGALGTLTALELPIIPCKPYVKLTYHPVHDMRRACDLFLELASRADPPELVEGLMFGRDRAIIMEGELADLPPGETVNHIERWYAPWFYKHFEGFLEKGEATEYIPLRAYYHRYTRSLYWHAELLVPFGNQPWFRYLLGWLMPPKVSFMKLTQTERIRKFRDARNVVQDVLVPGKALADCVDFFDREFECYPLWLCPHKTFRTTPQGMLAPSEPDLREELYVDVGAWQVPGFVQRGEPWDGRDAVRRMEAWVRAHHGYQCMYAVTEQTRAEFWQMFDGTLYEKVRAAYGAVGAYMDVYDKVKRPEME